LKRPSKAVVVDARAYPIAIGRPGVGELDRGVSRLHPKYS